MLIRPTDEEADLVCLEPPERTLAPSALPLAPRPPSLERRLPGVLASLKFESVYKL